MTAEIAILNKAAVALAADSTVTVRDLNNPRRIKTYQSANKLFTLSKYRPVGVMVYGNAGLMDIPWETLIKQYRKHLATKRFGTVEEYSDSFIEFLETSSDIFPEALQNGYFNATTFSYFVNRILKPVAKTIKDLSKGGKPDAAEIGKLYDKAVKQQWDEVSKVPISKNLPAKFETDLLKRFKKAIDSIIVHVFPNVPLSTASKRNLHRIAGRIVCGDMFPNTMSGVVIAGFGEDQIFPEVRTFSPHFVCRGKLIYRPEPEESHAITHGDNNAALIPFAQKDVVDSFLNGIDRRYLSIVHEAMQGLLSTYPNVVAQHIKETDPGKKAAVVAAIAADFKKMTDSLDNAFQEHRDKEHASPLLAVIASLPKNELAELAEALVNITSLKRKMSNELETVGGPIDVAVVSKGDGFIWIRRKHYFKSELNPHFVRNYHREPSHEGRR